MPFGPFSQSFRCSKQNILPQHVVLQGLTAYSKHIAQSLSASLTTTFFIRSLENELDRHERRRAGTRGTAIPAPAHSLSTSDEETRSGVLADAGDSEPRSRLNPKSYSGSSSMLPSRRGDSEWEEVTVLMGAQVRLRQSRGDVGGDGSEFLLDCVDCV